MNTRIKKPETCYDDRGKLVRLGRELGCGEESAVYRVGNEAAKIYKYPLDAERLGKLSSMIAMKSAEISDVASWPQRLLFDEQQRAIGCIIPRFGGEFLKIALVINPSSRPEYFAGVNWAWLIRAARELAEVVGKMHQAGIVIGDFNERKFLIAPDARIRLIDTDSFQVAREGKVWKASGAVPDYTPPELCKLDLRTVERTQEHDLFGLAVMIFQILMGGWHPWAGICHGFIDPGNAVGNRIPELPFAFSARAAEVGFVPPSNAPQFASLPPAISALFERAFQGVPVRSPRPTSAEWAAQLEAFEEELSPCAASPVHQYLPLQGPCPWCRLEYTIPRIIIFRQPTQGVVPAVLVPLQRHRISRRIDLLRNRLTGGLKRFTFVRAEKLEGKVQARKQSVREPTQSPTRVPKTKRFVQWAGVTTLALLLGFFWAFSHTVSKKHLLALSVTPTMPAHGIPAAPSKRVARKPAPKPHRVVHIAARTVHRTHRTPPHTLALVRLVRPTPSPTRRAVEVAPPPARPPAPPPVPALAKIIVPDIASLSAPSTPAPVIHEVAKRPLPKKVSPKPKSVALAPVALPEIVSLKANPESVAEGEQSSLCVESVHTHKLIVSSVGKTDFSVACFPVKPEHTTTYVVTAINEQGKGVRRSITVTVEPTPGPPTPEPTVAPTPEGRHRHHKRRHKRGNDVDITPAAQKVLDADEAHAPAESIP